LASKREGVHNTWEISLGGRGSSVNPDKKKKGGWNRGTQERRATPRKDNFRSDNEEGSDEREVKKKFAPLGHKDTGSRKKSQSI